MYRLPILSLAALALAGCAASGPSPGGRGDLAALNHYCENDADYGYFGQGLNGALNRRAYVERCIQSGGQTQQTRSGPMTQPMDGPTFSPR